MSHILGYRFSCSPLSSTCTCLTEIIEIPPSYPQSFGFPSQHTRQSFAEGSDDCDGAGDCGEYDMLVNIMVIVMVTVVVVMEVVIEMVVVVVKMVVTVVVFAVTVMVTMMAVDAGFRGKILHNR